MIQKTQIFTVKETSKITGIPLRRIQFYVEKGHITPAAKVSPGKGIAHEFNWINIIELGLINELAATGIPLTVIRQIFSGSHDQIKLYRDNLWNIISNSKLARNFPRDFLIIYRSGNKFWAVNLIGITLGVKKTKESINGDTGFMGNAKHSKGINMEIDYSGEELKTALSRDDFDAAVVVNCNRLIETLISNIT